MTERDLTTRTTQVFGDVKKGTECRICGRNVTDGRSKYCSDYCRDLARAVMRMLNWTSVRRRIIERDDRTCQECGFKEEWIDRGNDHIRAIIDGRLPERPEYPTLEEVAEGEEVDWDAYMERSQAWSDYRDELKDRYGDPWSRDNWLEVDHITPIVDGGHPFDPANLRTLCTDCHSEKTAQENSERAEERALQRPEIEAELADFVSDGGDILVSEVGDDGGDDA